MRTKTLALSAVLGLLGSASAMAANVYSINAVGYINVTVPPGWSILTCPLICSPDNTIATLLPASTFNGCSVFNYVNGSGFGGGDIASFSSWENGGTVTINPGTCSFILNSATPNAGNVGAITTTFVGTVPVTGGPYSLSQQLYAGYNLTASIVPYSGDYATGTIPGNFAPGGPGQGDTIFIFDPTFKAPNSQVGYNGPGDDVSFNFSSWSDVDPVTAGVAQGFWYLNSNSTFTWTENFSL